MCLLVLSVQPSVHATQGSPADHDGITQTRQIGDATFIQQQGQWSQLDGGVLFPVNPRVISLRLQAGIKIQDLLTTMSRMAPNDFGQIQQARVVRENRLGIIDLELPEGSDPVETASLMTMTGRVDFAVPNTIGIWLGGTGGGDPEFSNQYHLENAGQTGGTDGADIDALKAWDLQTGDRSVVIASLDSGCQINHPDLFRNIWTNDDEIPDNGIDDDGNGFIDDAYGWDFNSDDNTLETSIGHGTFVAGMACASSFNGVGVHGLAGGFGEIPGCALMPLVVGEFGPNSEVIDDAIIYAMDNGANIITTSLGIPSNLPIAMALTHAHDDGGMVITGAAGNSGQEGVSFPASHEAVIAISGTDHNDMFWEGSTYGDEIEFCAPALDVYSTNMGDGYGDSSGTSYASPLVAALAGLLISERPCLTNTQVRLAMRNSARDIGSTGWDKYSGFGRIASFEALLEAQEMPIPDECLDCPYDLSGNNQVGAEDLTMLLATWGQSDVDADFDGGGVGATDLAALLSNWSMCD